MMGAIGITPDLRADLRHSARHRQVRHARPDFDLRGNTEDVGEGKHFGDDRSSWVQGDLSTSAPHVRCWDTDQSARSRALDHDGVELNWVVNFQWQY